MMVDGEESGGEKEEELTQEEELGDVEVIDEYTGENGGGDVPEMEDEAEDLVDMAHSTFSLHNSDGKPESDSVFCVDISENEKWVLSGGEDNMAFLWTPEAPDTSAKAITGHKDSVTSVAFCKGDKYFVTADMGGFIQVFETESFTKVWEFEVGDVNWVKWHPVVPILLAGTVEGAVWMWKVPSFETKTIMLSGDPTISASFMSTNRHIAVAYQNGSVKVIDLKSGESEVNIEVRTEIVSIARAPDDKIIVTGSIDSTVNMIASQTGKVICCLQQTDRKQEDDNSVEDIMFHPTRPIVATACMNNKVCLWDTAHQKLRQSLDHPHGVNKVVWAGDRDHLVTSCLDGIIRVWDVDKNEVLAEVTGHAAGILDMKVSTNYVVTSSDDGTAKIFTIS